MTNKIVQYLRWLFVRDNDLITDLKSKIVGVSKLQREYSALIDETPKIYTTIKSFISADEKYYGWVKQLIQSDEYRYTIFDLRENTIREMTACNDASKLLEFNGRLNMLKILDAYLEKGLSEYENKVRGVAEGS